MGRRKKQSHRERCWKATAIGENGLRRLVTLDGELVEGTAAWNQYWSEIDRMDTLTRDIAALLSKKKRSLRRKISLRSKVKRNVQVNESGVKCLTTLDGVLCDGTPEWKAFWAGIRNSSSSSRRPVTGVVESSRVAPPSFDLLD